MPFGCCTEKPTALDNFFFKTLSRSRVLVSPSPQFNVLECSALFALLFLPFAQPSQLAQSLQCLLKSPRTLSVLLPPLHPHPSPLIFLSVPPRLPSLSPSLASTDPHLSQLTTERQPLHLPRCRGPRGSGSRRPRGEFFALCLPFTAPSSSFACATPFLRVNPHVSERSSLAGGLDAAQTDELVYMAQGTF